MQNPKSCNRAGRKSFFPSSFFPFFLFFLPKQQQMKPFRKDCEISLTHGELVGLEGKREFSVKAATRWISTSTVHKDLVFKTDLCVICFWPHYNVFCHEWNLHFSLWVCGNSDCVFNHCQAALTGAQPFMKNHSEGVRGGVLRGVASQDGPRPGERHRKWYD